MRHFLFLASILMLMSGSLRAQSKFFRENVRNGDEFFEQGPNFHRRAMAYFMRADTLDPSHADVKLKIGICCLNSYNKYMAKDYFKKAYEMNPDVAPDINYFLGICYQLDLQFDSAKAEYEKYRAKLSFTKKEDRPKIEELEKKIKETETGKKLMQSPVRVTIENMGPSVNSPYPDYSPVITADEDVLMFTSRRNTTTGERIDPNYDEYFEDIYQSFQFNGKWGQARNIGSPINSFGHDATANLSADGQKLLIYLDDKGAGNIYESTLQGSKWTVPLKMPDQISSPAHESSACYSYDGKTLYFVSDRSGGYGGSDIYMCKMKPDGTWGDVSNLGATINTPFDEESPFSMPDGKTLYFSSKGHETMGGFDIFKTESDAAGNWSQPANLGYPVNSADDDVSFVISANGRHGYYAAVKKEGQGNRDIYRLTFQSREKNPVVSSEEQLLAGINEPIISTAAGKGSKGSNLTLLKGIISDEKNNAPLDALIVIIDNDKGTELATFQSNKETGKYLVSLPAGKNYGIEVKKDSYLFHSENFDITANAGYQEITKNIVLKSIEVGKKVILKNVFYDFDKATLRPQSQTELNLLAKLMSENPGIRIELGSHTDNKGTEKYNLDLSQRRSQSVLEYLVSKGIDVSRLVAKGYGFTQPIAGNDTEQGRQLNRRTDFTIISK